MSVPKRYRAAMALTVAARSLGQILELALLSGSVGKSFTPEEKRKLRAIRALKETDLAEMNVAKYIFDDGFAAGYALALVEVVHFLRREGNRHGALVGVGRESFLHHELAERIEAGASVGASRKKKRSKETS